MFRGLRWICSLTRPLALGLIPQNVEVPLNLASILSHIFGKKLWSPILVGWSSSLMPKYCREEALNQGQRNHHEVIFTPVTKVTKFIVVF